MIGGEIDFPHYRNDRQESGYPHGNDVWAIIPIRMGASGSALTAAVCCAWTEKGRPSNISITILQTPAP